MRWAALGLIFGGLLLGGLLLQSVIGDDSLADRAPGIGDFAGGGDVIISDAVPFDPFDPGGKNSAPTNTERNQLAPNAFDDNIETAWQTETYDRAAFSGLKDGVGLRLILDESSKIDEIEISTSSIGWSIEVYVGDDIGPNSNDFDISALGSPNGEAENTERTQTVELDSETGGQILLWITETGTTIDESRGEVHRFVLNEVAVS